MAQIAANPWSFASTDQATTVAITSIANNTGSILVTTTSAHGYTNQFTAISIQGTTSYNGPYRILAIPSTTTLLLANQPKNFTAANGGAAGNVLSMAFLGNFRGEQVTWNPSAASQTLTLTDGYGDTIWNVTSQSAAPFGPFVYSKVFWVQNGLVLNAMPGGTLEITVN